MTAAMQTVPNAGAPQRPLPSARSTDRLLPVRRASSWRAHLQRFGPIELTHIDELPGWLNQSALVGRGGAGFPTGRKLAAVAAAVEKFRRPAVAVANCCEGDPTSLKDQVLAQHSPHLLIDGALLGAAAVRADRIVFAVHDNSATQFSLLGAIAERDGAAVRLDVVGVPDRYVASEATSLVRFLNTGDARPVGKLVPIWESGVDGRPTLVDNAETLAHLGLIGRFGPAWFAGVGTGAEPGTTLITIGGAVRRPGVVEVPNGARIRDVLACADAPATGWALLGGLAGRWVKLDSIADIGYSAADLGSIGLGRGVSSITVLPPDGCLLTETARILDFHANAGARQCGPCMFGLPAIAADMAGLAGGDRGALNRLRRRLPVINGRGGCGHPDGAVTLAASALAALSQRQSRHLAQHLQAGGCRAPRPVVPLTRTEPNSGGRSA
ncbi:MAG: NADH-ubiquinone oxidoreductase-F iron-sulfur binding region domain-containing protein [Nakamurella sp.]